MGSKDEDRSLLSRAVSCCLIVIVVLSAFMVVNTLTGQRQGGYGEIMRQLDNQGELIREIRTKADENGDKLDALKSEKAGKAGQVGAIN